MQRGLGTSNARSNRIGIKMDIGNGIVIAVGVEVEVELKSQSQSTWLQLNIYCGQTNKVGCMEKAAAVGRQEKGQSTKRNGKYNEGVTEGRTKRGGDRGQTAGRTNKQATKTLGKTVNVTVSAACQQAHTLHTHTHHTHRQAGSRAGRQALPDLDLELHLPLLVAANFGATK